MSYLEKEQFDISLGGSENIPHELNILKFASARMKEIAFMKNSIENPNNTKLVFQKLPIHMRRRVMSHHAKRLPRKSREAHLSQLEKSGMPPKQKRPSRKHRRRPIRLQSEYIRRQRRVTWLETHIWHAKRFHMVEKWGYKLPDRPCDKAFRACYRASSKHCLLQDISYFGCIELTGPEQVLIEKLKRVTNPATGLTFAAKAFLKGNREGSTTIYNIDTFPRCAVGSVFFIWKKSLEDIKDESSLWVWVHPSYYAAVIHLFITLFDLVKVNEVINVNETSNDEKMDSDLIELKNNLETKQTKEFNIPTYKNNLNIYMKELKFELNRFRLTGPLSQAILKQIIKFPNKENLFENNYLQNLMNQESENIFKQQYDFWENLNVTSPGELPPHLILGLNILDPRFSYPLKRTKACFSHFQDVNIPDFKPTISYSLIWDINIRESVAKNKISNAEICKENSKQLVPGLKYSLISQKCALPILLIQRPGSKENNLGYGSGYDIIIPKSWGLPFWHTMVMWGARVGGLRENRVNILENKRGKELFPDTKAGQQEENRIEVELKQKYFKLPPKKRINFIKIGIVSPFKPNWNLLIKEWGIDCIENEIHENDFYVLRDQKKLNYLKDFISQKKQLVSDCAINFDQPALVGVKLVLNHRGLIKDNAVICLPLESDILEKKAPVEPLHKDLNQNERKLLRKDHINLLKKLSRQRVRIKKKLQESNDSYVSYKSHVTNTKKIIETQAEKMQSLWLPKIIQLRKSSSREIMGFVSHGDFCFCDGKATAVGYIALCSLKFLKNNNVLVRNNSSRQYRFASIDIII